MISIEDYPFIIRFKTWICNRSLYRKVCIEDYPFIIRFKTEGKRLDTEWFDFGIEDYPFIIRFKTTDLNCFLISSLTVLRTIHL